MADTFEVAVLIGSLRANSNSGRLAAALERVAPPSLQFRNLPIGGLPLYNEDHEGETAPEAYLPFRSAIAKADGILFVTPEYNRSIPGGLKNAIDVASRPYGKGPIIGKPAAILSSSPGAIGGFGANHILRQSLVFLNMPVVQQPEAYLGHITESLDHAGEIVSDQLRELLAKFAAAFEALIRKSA